MISIAGTRGPIGMKRVRLGQEKEKHKSREEYRGEANEELPRLRCETNFGNASLWWKGTVGTGHGNARDLETLDS